MIVDNDTIFDEALKRYYLTKEYVLNELDTNLQSILIDEFSSNTSKLADLAIQDACDMVYDYLENNAIHKNTAIYRYCTEQNVFNALKKALGYQLLFYIQQGDLSNDIDRDIRFTVNKRAIQALRRVDLFNTAYYDIPDEEEW